MSILDSGRDADVLEELVDEEEDLYVVRDVMSSGFCSQLFLLMSFIALEIVSNACQALGSDASLTV